MGRASALEHDERPELMRPEAWIRERVLELGFDDVGYAELPGDGDSFPEGDRFREWLDRGYDAAMSYLARTLDKRADPQLMMPGARTAVVMVERYPGRSAEPLAGEGRVASYARGRDYHNVLRRRLRKLLRDCRERWVDEQFYGCVDTGPVLERAWAVRAGLGWAGKNSLLLNEDYGSNTLLAVVYTTLSLTPATPVPDQCGDCTLCLDACPTDAFPGPYVVDARRCVSYLTIELREDIPIELRAGVGDHLFGCDDCLDVCPYNHGPLATLDPAFGPPDTPLHESLEAILGIDDDGFADLTTGRPLARPRRDGLVRNACVVAGNSGDLRYIPALERLRSDASAMVQRHAAWALERLRVVE